MANSFSKIITRILKEDGFLSKHSIGEGVSFSKRYLDKKKMLDKNIKTCSSISEAVYRAFFLLTRESVKMKSYTVNYEYFYWLYDTFRYYVKPVVRVKVGDKMKIPKYIIMSTPRNDNNANDMDITIIGINERTMSVKIAYQSLSRRKKDKDTGKITQKWIPMIKFGTRQISYTYR